MRHLFLVFVFSLLSFALAQKTLACGPPEGPAEIGIVSNFLPTSGSIDVPLNTQFIARTHLFPSDIRVELVEGENIFLPPYNVQEGNLLVVTPTEELQANRDYELRVSFTAFEGDDELTQIITSFRTGERIDTEPPQGHEILSSPQIDFTPMGENNLPCGPAILPDQWVVTLNLEHGEDDSQVAGYRLIRLEENGGRTTEISIWPHSDLSNYTYATLVDPEGTYFVEAFDIDGNASESALISFGAEVEIDDSIDSEQSGCSSLDVSSGRIPFEASLLIVPIALLWRTRRRT